MLKHFVVDRMVSHSLHLDSGLLEGFFHVLKAVVEAGRPWVLIVSGPVQRIATIRQHHPQSRAAGFPGFPCKLCVSHDVAASRNSASTEEHHRLGRFRDRDASVSRPRFKLFSHVRHGQDSLSFQQAARQSAPCLLCLHPGSCAPLARTDREVLELLGDDSTYVLRCARRYHTFRLRSRNILFFGDRFHSLRTEKFLWFLQSRRTGTPSTLAPSAQLLSFQLGLPVEFLHIPDDPEDSQDEENDDYHCQYGFVVVVHGWSSGVGCFGLGWRARGPKSASFCSETQQERGSQPGQGWRCRCRDSGIGISRPPLWRSGA